jgi:hypothetical protein
MAQTKRGIELVDASAEKSGSSTVELFGLPILESVEKSLECPICFCIPEKMAVQCSLGHIACLECIESCEVNAREQHRTKCATCRVDMKKPYAPSPLANALLLGLSDECKHCKVRAPWAELHAKHNNNCLPFKRRKVQEVSADGTLTNFEGLHGSEAIVSIHRKNDAGEPIVEEYEGPRNEERLVRKSRPDQCCKYFFDGPPKYERLVRVELCIDSSWFETYEGPHGEERLVRRKKGTNGEDHYDGPKGNERLIREVDEHGKTTHYSGERGSERVTMKESEDFTYYYAGERGSERVIMKESEHCSYYYEGEKGKECLRRKVLIFRSSKLKIHVHKIGYFKGDAGNECCHKVVDVVMRSTEIYKGTTPKTNKRVLTVFEEDGRKEFFTGERKRERKVKVLFTNGLIFKYSGERGSEQKTSEHWCLAKR